MKPKEKSIKLSPAAVTVLASMNWSEDGTRCSIEAQLERDLYLEVNKALESLGGVWNKKAKAHIFEFDPRGDINDIVGSEVFKVVKDGFFETPPAIVKMMIDEIGLPVLNERCTPRILEPSAGEGAIALILRRKYPDAWIDCIEQNAKRCVTLSEKLGTRRVSVLCSDFMEIKATAEKNVDCVYMNPPLENQQDSFHVMHAFEFLRIGGKLAAVMSEGTFFRNDKAGTTFRSWLEQVGGKSVKLPPESFKGSGTGVGTRLVFITKMDNKQVWKQLELFDTAEFAKGKQDDNHS
jgi:hypothetical protein